MKPSVPTEEQIYKLQPEIKYLRKKNNPNSMPSKNIFQKLK
jgi:hypothetical protein